MRASFALVLGLIGCASGPPKSSDANHARPSLSPPPASTAPVENVERTAPPPAPSLDEIVEPSQVACRIGSDAWTAWKLRTSASGPVFAHVHSAPSQLLVPVETAPKALVAVMDDKQVLLRAVLASEDADVYVRAPTLLAGVLSPTADKSLLLRAGKPNVVRVGVDASSFVKTPEIVEDDLGCDALTIVAASFDARASITKRPKLPERLLGPNGADLTKTPGGERVVTLKGDIAVGVLEARGASTRVLLDGADYFLVGWVKSKDLSGGAGIGTFGRGAGYGAGYGKGIAHPQLTRCSRDVDLIVEVGGDKPAAAKVGILRAGAPFLIPQATGEDLDPNGRAAIQLWDIDWLMLEKNARMTLVRRDLEACKAE